MYRLYTLLLILITPWVLLRLLWRSLRQPAYRLRIHERFGDVTAPAEPIAVWVHAVSVGESLAALPLIRQLVARHGPRRVWVTTTTPTGSDRINDLLGDQVLHSYAPYDLPWVVSRFLDRVRPRQAVVMETELWPNLFRALRERNIALTIANARLSPHSYQGYSRVREFARRVLADTTLIAAQSALDAAHFEALGARRVEIMGNLKFDIEPPADQVQAGQRLRMLLGADRPVWVAASTHEGEEAAALTAHARVREWLPNALLILVPRHPQRFDEVARLLQRRNFAHLRRSGLDLHAGPASPDAGSVLLGDSLGEMWMYLAAADVAFVGGSLGSSGGHNILEPAVLERPVMFGPSMHNFAQARELLLSTGAAREITQIDSLPRLLIDWLRDPVLRTRMGKAGRRAVAMNRGALARLLERLDEH